MEQTADAADGGCQAESRTVLPELSVDRAERGAAATDLC